jgi:hypothetical protein
MAVFWVMIALMMEEESTSETSVNYQTARYNNPEDSHLHTNRRENLKSHLINIVSDSAIVFFLKISIVSINPSVKPRVALRAG